MGLRLGLDNSWKNQLTAVACEELPLIVVEKLFGLNIESLYQGLPSAEQSEVVIVG